MPPNVVADEGMPGMPGMMGPMGPPGPPGERGASGNDTSMYKITRNTITALKQPHSLYYLILYNSTLVQYHRQGIPLQKKIQA